MSDNIPHLDDIVQVLAKKHSLTSFTIEVNTGSTKGDNYVGMMFNLKLSGSTNISVMVKIASNSTVFREKIPLEAVFQREIYVYKEVFPKMEDFQRERGILEIYTPYPKVFYTNVGKGTETVVLDDLKQYDFKMLNREVHMDHEHVAFVLQNYGRLHALSFAMKHKNPDLFADLTRSINFPFVVPCTNSKDIKTHISSIKPYFDEQNEKHIRKKLDSFVIAGEKLAKVAVEPNEFSVICHGDGWCNNMMFKYGDKSTPNKPTKMCFVDYQLTSFCSVVLDLSYFIYTCASKEVLDDLDRYLMIYHDSLSSFLEELGCNPRELFTFEDLKREWKRSCIIGFLHALLVVRGMLVDVTNAFHLEDVVREDNDLATVFVHMKHDEEEFKRRTINLVTHLCKNEFI